MMSDQPAPALSAPDTLQQAARALILKQLSDVMQHDADWLAVCRKRIKDRMSDAKHIAFNNELKIKVIESQLEKGRSTAVGLNVKTVILEHQALTERNQQLARTTHICALALGLLDRQRTEEVAA